MTPLKTFEQINQEYNDALTAEYERIRDNFLEEIHTKIVEFKVARDKCRRKCLSDFCNESIFSGFTGNKKDPEVCKQVGEMMQSKGDYEVATFCKVSPSEKVKESCAAASGLQRKIQDLFNMHKTKGSFDDNVSEEEAKFYALTTKPKSNTGGNRRCTKSKRHQKKKRTTKRKTKFPKKMFGKWIFVRGFRRKPQNKIGVKISKMDIFKNVQKWKLRDYLFFWKKNFQKFENIYFHCIIGKESKKFQNVIFFKTFLRVGQKLGEFCCAFFSRDVWEKVPTKIRWKMYKNETTRFFDICCFCASNKMSLHFVEGCLLQKAWQKSTTIAQWYFASIKL